MFGGAYDDAKAFERCKYGALGAMPAGLGPLDGVELSQWTRMNRDNLPIGISEYHEFMVMNGDFKHQQGNGQLWDNGGDE